MNEIKVIYKFKNNVFLNKHKHFKLKTLLVALICFAKLKTQNFKHMEIFLSF
jgi:hypothetical protein